MKRHREPKSLPRAAWPPKVQEALDAFREELSKDPRIFKGTLLEFFDREIARYDTEHQVQQ